MFTRKPRPKGQKAPTLKAFQPLPPPADVAPAPPVHVAPVPVPAPAPVPTPAPAPAPAPPSTSASQAQLLGSSAAAAVGVHGAPERMTNVSFSSSSMAHGLSEMKGTSNVKHADVERKSVGSAMPMKLSVASSPASAMGALQAKLAHDRFVARKVKILKDVWKSAHGPLRTVDFADTGPGDHVRDLYEALTCITVATMTGTHGSITHLNFGDVDPAVFAAALRVGLGEHAEGARVILVGGSWGDGSRVPQSAQEASQGFYTALREALIKEGFTIAAEDVGGAAGRHSSLYADHVSVSRGPNTEPTSLPFS